ncbi:sigma-70 family RNA polymerase sigma factor [Bacillus cihuensis]|uniref:sigma-70 family RNA polymerase sigma factor n=1 Tax=Bacillus cihuensis TaxID=1208599 RepID=UPI00041A8DC3|nr:sigma-70 family RNA polymerase sigma factor [Bacillus cihuensis]
MNATTANKVFTPEFDKEKVAEENIRLVYKVVWKFRNMPFDYDDILSAGMFGFNNALNSYDPNENVKFSTFAYTCIKNEIYLFMNEQRWDKRKANISAISIDEKVDSDGKDELTIKNLLQNPESEYDWQDINEAVETVVRKLTVKQRTIFLKFLEDKRQLDIAKEIGRTKQTVSLVVRDTLEKIRVEYWRGM